MNRMELMVASDIVEEQVALDNLIGALEATSIIEVELLASDPKDEEGQPFAADHKVVVERGALLEFLRAQRDYCMQRLTRLGVE